MVLRTSVRVRPPVAHHVATLLVEITTLMVSVLLLLLLLVTLTAKVRALPIVGMMRHLAGVRLDWLLHAGMLRMSMLVRINLAVKLLTVVDLLAHGKIALVVGRIHAVWTVWIWVVSLIHFVSLTCRASLTNSKIFSGFRFSSFFRESRSICFVYKTKQTFWVTLLARSKS